jgi:hypothetical protein
MDSTGCGTYTKWNDIYEKEWNLVGYMNGTGDYYVKWNEQGIGSQILHNFTRMWNIK